MDINGPPSYKSPTLFQEWKKVVLPSTIEQEMDKEFLHQIDEVDELVDGHLLEKLDDEVLICECFCVNVQDIRKICSPEGKVDFSVLEKEYGLGRGCQSCLKNAVFWQDKIF